VFQTPLGFSNVSAFSARSAVKLGGIVISLEKSIVAPKGDRNALDSDCIRVYPVCTRG